MTRHVVLLYGSRCEMSKSVRRMYEMPHENLRKLVMFGVHKLAMHTAHHKSYRGGVFRSPPQAKSAFSLFSSHSTEALVQVSYGEFQ